MKCRMLLSVLLMLLSFSSMAKSIEVIKGRKSNIVIVATDNKIEHLAATELSKFLKNLTSIEIPIVSEAEYRVSYNKKSAIVVGTPLTNGIVKENVNDDDLKSFTFESVLLRTVDFKTKSMIMVTGIEPKGVLNGAYTLMEEILKDITHTEYPDVDYVLPDVVENLIVQDLNISKTPYCTVNGLELEGMGLGNSSLLDNDKRSFEYKKWCTLVDWAKRHKMNFISNWPYSGESSMNNFPDIVVMKNYKKISKFSEMEIREAAKYRNQFFKYASDNGLDPYIMVYVPGWINKYIASSYPEFVGDNFQEFVAKSGGHPYNWGNPDVHQFMADLVTEVVKTYPEINGIHLRVWGSESAPDAEHKHQSAELIQIIIKKMVEAAYAQKPNIKIMLSGYSNFKDKTFSYARSLPGNLILQMKWDDDWAVSNDPRIPKEWLGVKDHILRAVSHSIPNEEAIPFWFPSAKLYQEGIQKYLKKGETTISGFPINFREWDTGVCDNDLNLSAIARLNWEPFTFDNKKFYADNYRLLFGEKAASDIIRASEIAGEVMAGFLTDYGGIIEGMWPGNYFCLKALIGKGDDDKWYRAIRHITSKADRPDYLLKCRARLEKFATQQKEVVELLEGTKEYVDRNLEIYNNMLYVYSGWYYILQSRIAAIDVVLNKDEVQKQVLLDRFISSDEFLKYYVRQMTNFSQKAVGDYPSEIRRDFLNRITAEQEYMENNYAPKEEYKIVDSRALESVKLLYKNLKRIEGKNILFGHQDDLAYGNGWKYIPKASDVEKVTGQYPAVIGHDLGHIGNKNNIDSVPFDLIRRNIIDAYNMGAINTISWHMKDLVNGGEAWVEPQERTVNTVKEILPGAPYHARLLQKLDLAADFFHSLKGADGKLIPVIFRPYHEHNGNWFWWGRRHCSNDDYKHLFRFTVNYLINVRGVHNLLFAYSPNSVRDKKEYLERFPGESYVDIIGFDNYQTRGKTSQQYIDDMERNLKILCDISKSLDKISAVNETGYECIPESKWWTNTLYKAISQYPIVYVLCWRNGRPDHYYVPYPGQKSSADFRAFCRLPGIQLLNKDLMLYE